MANRAMLNRLVLRSLIYHWRTNLAVIAGVATAVAVLSGALLVGKSIRESLRLLLYERLGTTEYVVSADRFFREDLASIFSASAPASPSQSCPIIYVQGVLIKAGTGMRAYNVNVYGVDERFWKFQNAADQKPPEGNTALLGDALARKLNVRPGDPVLLRIETQQGIPREWLYGRRENVGRTVRLSCGEILPAGRLGEFALRPTQGSVYSIFVPLRLLQRDLKQPAGANTILLAPKEESTDQNIRESLRAGFTLADVGINLRPLPMQSGVAVESNRMILDDSSVKATLEAAAAEELKTSGVFTYLANSIRAERREIPYSVITAADMGQGELTNVTELGGSPAQSAPHGADDDVIWLNDWAARELGISKGDPVEVDYYVWLEEGRLVTRTARFHLAGVIAIGGDIDATLTPDFPGITEARSMKSWDPPFPVDLNRIRPKDEEYWDHYRATPKAVIPLKRGQELWQNRFGRLSSIRIETPQRPGFSVGRLGEDIRSRLDPEQAGFMVNSVRKGGLAASQGSTDFGEYFIYFSFFLIAAAVLFAALFFKLGIEQRLSEIGTLQAMGFSRSTLRLFFLLEGLILSLAGSLLGILGAIGYGTLMVFGLRTWWVAAVGTQRLHLYASWMELASGALAGIVASIGVIVWTLHGLRQISPRSLLAGVLESNATRHRRNRAWTLVLSAVAFAAAVIMILASTTGAISQVEGFFGAGLLLLISMLTLTAFSLRRAHLKPIQGGGWRAFCRLGARNTMHRPARSLLCIALIGSATFIIVSMEAFRQNPQSGSMEKLSGTGGYPLMADSALPILQDPNSSEGRETLGLPGPENPELSQVKFVPFRLRPGDDASCLNLYAPKEPRILGAPHAFVAGGRFLFQDSLASTPNEKKNPWLLVESTPQDGTIPAIGDANTIQYILHLSLGSVLTLRGSTGVPVRLRLVGALQESVLQGELIVSEANFLRAFPDQEGYRFFFLEVPPANVASVTQKLTENLADWGFNIESTQDRLAGYLQVENTYLSTFQALGALGLILGTAGLASVLLRNVLERRQELALLRAIGYRKPVLSAIIVAENVVLVICGLACGALCALLSIIPAVHTRAAPFPLSMMAMLLIAVLLVGLTSSLLAVVAALRSPVVTALGSE